MTNFPKSIDDMPPETAASATILRVETEHLEGLHRLQALIFDWCHDGTLSRAQVRAVCDAYNGGPCIHDTH